MNRTTRILTPLLAWAILANSTAFAYHGGGRGGGGGGFRGGMAGGGGFRAPVFRPFVQHAIHGNELQSFQHGEYG